MRKNIFLLGALLAVSAATMAQTKQGGISAQMLSQIEKMQKKETSREWIAESAKKGDISR